MTSLNEEEKAVTQKRNNGKLGKSKTLNTDLPFSIISWNENCPFYALIPRTNINTGVNLLKEEKGYVIGRSNIVKLECEIRLFKDFDMLPHLKSETKLCVQKGELKAWLSSNSISGFSKENGRYISRQSFKILVQQETPIKKRIGQFEHELYFQTSIYDVRDVNNLFYTFQSMPFYTRDRIIKKKSSKKLDNTISKFKREGNEENSYSEEVSPVLKRFKTSLSSPTNIIPSIPPSIPPALSSAIPATILTNVTSTPISTNIPITATSTSTSATDAITSTSESSEKDRDYADSSIPKNSNGKRSNPNHLENIGKAMLLITKLNQDQLTNVLSSLEEIINSSMPNTNKESMNTKRDIATQPPQSAYINNDYL
jgi:hypothetical protein